MGRSTTELAQDQAVEKGRDLVIHDARQAVERSFRPIDPSTPENHSVNPLQVVVLTLESFVQTVGIRAGVEQPQYRTILRDGLIEVREYAPRIVAETTVSGPVEAARNAGFRKVAAYIFGSNRGAKDVAMTSPVVQQSGQAVPMTSPVVQGQSRGVWRIQFVMPAKYTLEQLPDPLDADVELKQEPAARYAVMRFSGSRSGTAIELRTETLLREVKARGFEVKATPVAWFYDPPWTLPVLRRNEVAVQVK